MALNYRLFESVSLIVVGVLIWDCMGIIPIRGSTTGTQKSKAITGCNFGNKNFTIGQEWNPHLEPRGINYCIKCRCKKDGLIHCESKTCKAISCPGKLVPSGKCCPVCPSPQNIQLSKKECQYHGKRYQQGEVWNVPMRKDVGDNNCAECTCHNGKVSCAVRICPKLKCAKMLQIPGKDSCCAQCRGFPLAPIDSLLSFQPAVITKGSCYEKGRYYKDKDIWNPLKSYTTESKMLHQPNCDICICQSTTVKCNKVSCPKLQCDNPIQANADDCCKSCPDKKDALGLSVKKSSLPQNTTVKKTTDSKYPDCKFLSKIYKHNTSWSPQIPGHNDPNTCLRCTCELSQIKCNRNGCLNKTSCSGKSCSNSRVVKPSAKPNLDKRWCSSVDGVEVYLFVNEKSKQGKRQKAKQNYIARIAVISPKESSVKVHFWDASDNKVTLKSRSKKSRFEKRKTNYVKLGETKIGRINRFFNKEKTLAKCVRGCKNKARDFIHILKTRVRYCKRHRAKDLFESLKPSSRRWQ